MIKISQELRVQFEALLAQEEIPKKLHSEYLKWLRYYLDFCHKYGFEKSKKQGVSHFIKKLHNKRQTSQQRRHESLNVVLFRAFNLSCFRDYVSEFSARKNPKIIAKVVFNQPCKAACCKGRFYNSQNQKDHEQRESPYPISLQ